MSGTMYFNSMIPFTLVCVLSQFSCVWLSETPWTATPQNPLFRGFSKQEYWRQLPCSPPGDLADPGAEPMSLMSPALAGGFLTARAAWEALVYPCAVLCNAQSLRSCPTLCDLRTVAHQAPLFMQFSTQEYWSGLPFPSPGPFTLNTT